jgi:hypothetical protein
MPTRVPKGYPTEEQIAASLRADLGIDDAGLKKILAMHLTSRLDDLDETISRAGQILFGAIAEVAPSGPWRQATVHLAQWENEDLPGTIEELLAARVRYRLAAEGGRPARGRRQAGAVRRVR